MLVPRPSVFLYHWPLILEYDSIGAGGENLPESFLLAGIANGSLVKMKRIQKRGFDCNVLVLQGLEKVTTKSKPKTKKMM